MITPNTHICILIIIIIRRKITPLFSGFKSYQVVSLYVFLSGELIVVLFKEENLEGGFHVFGQVALVPFGGFVDVSDFVEAMFGDYTGVVELLVDVYC